MADGTIALNARIGRTSVRAWTPVNRAPDGGRTSGTAGAWALLLALALALWPHGAWMARRLTDGSDEPWGILALATAVLLVGHEWRRLATPGRGALLASAALALAAAFARHWLPALGAAAIAMMALATFLGAARRDRPAAPLASLLLLALPVIATLQFYLGYPLRVVTATLAAPLLQGLSFDVQAAGAALAFDGRLVLVDPPCAGIGMLWVGAYTAALLSCLHRASTRRTLATAVVAAASVFVANVARNVALFFPEALGLGWPAWTHAAIGLVAFVCALTPIVWFAQRAAQPRCKDWPAWPPRHHRHAP